MTSIDLPPIAPNTIRLPSISELTLRSPISDDRLPSFRKYVMSPIPAQTLLPQSSSALSPSLYWQGQPVAPPPTNHITPHIPHIQQHVQQAPHAAQYYQPYPIYYQQPYLPEVINKPINKCHRCGTTETPEWRRGPNGVRTLCNACGLFHAKLVKRKGAALAAEEVLNNKVCKGKNGRRISIKKHMFNESLLKGSGMMMAPIVPGYYPVQMIRQ